MPLYQLPPSFDFDTSPLLVFYELTRACDLVCRHCRACAQPRRHPNELSTQQAFALLDQLATFPRPPLLVLTGGDPLKRADLFEIIRHGRQLGLSVALTPSATPLVTLDVLARLKAEGLNRLAVSLDGVDTSTHDAMRGVSGSFLQTLSILCDARDLGLSTQVNTTVTQRNLDQLDRMAHQLALFDIALWSLFFLVPVGRGRVEPRLSAEQYEQAFEILWRQSQTQPYAIKTTEAPHYRRFVLQHADTLPRVTAAAGGVGGPTGPPMTGVRDGNGVMFVSHVGQVFPSGFMPITCGRFPQDSVVDVYQHGELFKQLRNPDGFRGKCGVCEFRHVCGGSRARAYAVSGDPLASEPDCSFVPEAVAAASR
ncbi:TIGR04053 family radical SAM/SPASM domain-containing protein [Phycisphaerales bacterium AB-hyl4]|uniref:TIGR04053 family radical SAM/SPASM domain-containing protein n=1 Tax=Natronomicrosphaera hydrolytica TaxID=3242702 RepID=A0ABV4U587_9BACT